jgi:hypothetical protein
LIPLATCTGQPRLSSVAAPGSRSSPRGLRRAPSAVPGMPWGSRPAAPTSGRKRGGTHSGHSACPAALPGSAGGVSGRLLAPPPPARYPAAFQARPRAPGAAPQPSGHLGSARRGAPRPPGPEPTPYDRRSTPIRCPCAPSDHASSSSGPQSPASGNASTPADTQRPASGNASVPTDAQHGALSGARTPIRAARPRERTASRGQGAQASTTCAGPIVAQRGRPSGDVHAIGTGPDTVPRDAEGGSYERGAS